LIHFWRRVTVTLAAFGLATPASPAGATPCREGEAPPVLSEARAARWLIGDDLRLNASVDVERLKLEDLYRALDEKRPAIYVFATTGFSWQSVGSIPTCDRRGAPEGRFDRWRVHAAAGAEHVATRLSARVSFVHAMDAVLVPVEGGDDEDEAVLAGYQQSLVSARFGHDRWLRGFVGYVTSESTFATSRAIARANPTTRAPGFFIGATVPAIHTSVVTLLQQGQPELVSVMASDLRPSASLPLSLSLGPTYLREERQTVGLLRLRGVSAGSRREPSPETQDGGDGALHGFGKGHSSFGPVAEVSMESMDGRLRHARLRFEAEGLTAFVAKDHAHKSSFYGGAHAEGTVFRSRAFQASAGAAPRPAAWGFGGRVFAGFRCDWLTLSLDWNVNRNRPELLSLVPSAADRIEMHGAFSIGVDH